jgi:hypothetical protein
MLSEGALTPDLIARLEAATEGGRELDEEIANRVGHAHSIETALGPDIVYDPPYPSGVPRCNPARYTTSIDAALTLTEDFYGIRLVRHAKTKRWRAMLMGCTGCSKTPALAVCIAVLKARSAKE